MYSQAVDFKLEDGRDSFYVSYFAAAAKTETQQISDHCRHSIATSPYLPFAVYMYMLWNVIADGDNGF